MSKLSNHIADHMVASMNRAVAEVDPFPHVIVANFFPDDVYWQLLDTLPGDTAYETVNYEKNVGKDGSANRLRLGMDEVTLSKLPDNQCQLLSAVRDALASPQLKHATFAKMARGVAYRYGIEESKVNDVEAAALPEMYREHSGYCIKPHPDTRKKIVTMQISLPRDTSQRALGTEFYRRSFNPANLLREPRGFEIVKTTPYIPNTAYAFSVLNAIGWKSWHGRCTLPGNSGTRNTILNIWYTKSSIEKRESKQRKMAA